jgi:hypothetical protein
VRFNHLRGSIAEHNPAPSGGFPAELAWMTKPKSVLVLRLPGRLFSSNFDLPRWVTDGS